MLLKKRLRVLSVDYRAVLLCSLTILMSVLCVGCAPDRIPLHLSISNPQSDATSQLEVTLFLNGQPSNERSLAVNRRLDQFTLEIPPEARGVLRVHVSALRADGCSVAQGDKRIPLAYPAVGAPLGPDVVLDGARNFSIELTQESDPCAVGVRFHGEGSITVTSAPAGIDCHYSCDAVACKPTGVCSYPFGADQTVSLIATPAPNSYLSDWSGPCTGQGTCVLNTHGDAKLVTAVVSMPPTCSSSNFCPADPLPCGDEITAIFQNDDSELYVGRSYCGVWQYSKKNRKWSQVVPLDPEHRQRIRSIWSNGPDDVWAAGDAGLLVHRSSQFGVHQLASSIKSLVGIGASNPVDNGILAITGNGKVLWLVDTADGIQQPAASAFYSQNDQIWTVGKQDFWIASSKLKMYGPGDLGRLSLVGEKASWGKQIEHEWRWSTGTHPYELISIAGTQSNEVWFLTRGGILAKYDGSTIRDIAEVGCDTKNCNATLASSEPGQVWVLDNTSDWGSRLFRYRDNMLPPERLGLPSLTGNFQTGWRTVTTPSGALTLLEPRAPELGFMIWSYHAPLMDWTHTLVPPLPGATEAPPDFVAVAGGVSSELWLLTERGEIYRRAEGQHSPYVSDTIVDGRIRGVWSQGSENVWFVGEKGTVAHFDGQRLHRLAIPTTSDLNAVWGTSYSDVWIVGEQLTLLHWNGMTFQGGWGVWPPPGAPPNSTEPSQQLGLGYVFIGGTSSGNVWVAGAQRIGGRPNDGDAILRHWDGTNWDWDRIRQPGTSIMGLFVSGNNDVWLSSIYQRALHFEKGKGETYFALGWTGVTHKDAQTILWGDGATMYALGNPSADTRGMLRVVDPGSTQPIRAVWGQGSDIWAVGNRGTILRYRPLGYRSP